MEEPRWLEGLLRTSFFNICPRHLQTPKNECNLFCLSCQNAAFCFYCRSTFHIDHPVLQIRRSSYHDVVRLSEIEKVLDIRGVQTYVINGAKVVFLNPRPQPKSSSSSTPKAISYLCQTCCRTLLDPFSFCSLGCKVKGIRKDKEEEEEEEEEEERKRKEREEGTHKGKHPPTHSSNSNSTRRKGIPHRAPFHS